MSAGDLQERLLAVVAASGSLLRSPRVDDVIPAVLRIARDLVDADGYAVWRFENGSWRMRSFEGVSEQFAARILSNRETPPAATLAFTEPLIIKDVLSDPTLADRAAVYANEGIRSVIAVPLGPDGAAQATLVLYYRRPHTFTPVELETVRAVGNVASTALMTAELYDEQQQTRAAAELGQRRARYLADVGETLASSLDYETTLKAVARLTVPDIADWCAVDIVDDRGQLQNLAVAHVDPEKVHLAAKLRASYPEPHDAVGGVWQAIRTGQPTTMEYVPPELLDAAGQDEEHRRLLRSIGITSYVCVPLLTRGRASGAITFVSAESGRRYGAGDVRFAQDVASRAALAVENARAYQQASDANRLKDEFLGTLSHELRTPLNAILGYARMLRGGVITNTAKQSRALEILERNAQALTQIVEDVLDVSRIIAGKMRLNLQEVDLAAVIEDATATVLPAAEARSVRVHLQLDQQTPPVAGDPERLQQVVWNLLSNAVKFTPPGGRVDVRLTHDEGKSTVVVSDTGRGVSPSFLPHIFERFRQADSRFSREHGGLGLGLAIAREIVETHGGIIVASSAGEGLGATFSFSLPVVSAEHRAERRASAHDNGEAMPSIRGRLAGVRVLVVDDDDDARNLVQAIVEEAGGTATIADSAVRALERLDVEVPDVMIADLGMPGMDGLALVEAIRRRPDEASRMPAIALTAYARSHDRMRALGSGFQRHLAKPIDHAQLVSAVTAVVTRTRHESKGSA